MNWESIIMAVLGLGVFGDIAMRFLFKSHRRKDDADADTAEAHADSAKAQADTDEWRRYKEELDNYHSTIATLQQTILSQAQQNNALVKDHATERAELEQRFNSQTDRLRDVQREYAQCLERETEYARKIGRLELELERKRCDKLECPFRQPPTAHTKSAEGQSIEEYMKDKS